MDIKKILFCTGEGIGNTIQCLPTIRTLVEVVGLEVDLWHAFGSYKIPDNLFPYIDKMFVGQQLNKADFSSYDALVSTPWTRAHINALPLRPLNIIGKISAGRSEVDLYMDIARDMGIKEEALLWDAECNYNKSDEYFDLVIHNGFNFKGDKVWRLKSYPRYEEIVRGLPDIKICSVGSKNEYIPGTIDRTGLPLMDSLGIIKNSRLFIGNDSGLYHCANALGTDNIVLFTFTSIKKNYDSRFHSFSTVIHKDLECISCQNTPRFKKCTTHECRDIPVGIINKAIIDKLRI